MNALDKGLEYHKLRVYKSKENLPKEKQLAYKIAKMVCDNVKISKEVEDMVINRIIDNASVAIASLERRPVANARATVPESAPNATPLDILVCESPPIIIAQSSTVKSFNTL